jgi:hypothetical protein
MNILERIFKAEYFFQADKLLARLMAFKKVHDDHGLPGKLEIPMDYFSRAVEYLLLEAPLEDGEKLQFGAEIMERAVIESRYVEALRAYSGGVPSVRSGGG